MITPIYGTTNPDYDTDTEESLLIKISEVILIKNGSDGVPTIYGTSAPEVNDERKVLLAKLLANLEAFGL